jgi:hypothetical protein
VTTAGTRQTEILYHQGTQLHKGHIKKNRGQREKRDEEGRSHYTNDSEGEPQSDIFNTTTKHNLWRLLQSIQDQANAPLPHIPGNGGLSLRNF